MSNVTAKKVLDIARAWVGKKESDGSFKEILDTYNSHKPLARGYAIKTTDEWCDTFVSAVAIKAGAVDLIGTEVGCEHHVKIFQEKGIWIEDGTIIPQPGDIILYNWDDSTQPNDGASDHIGYVESVSVDTIVVIEGNMSSAVGRRKIKRGWGFVRGYARPKYAVETTTKIPTPTQSEKVIDSVAREVIAGKWGVMPDRKIKLTQAGYDYEEIQKRVNTILKG